MNGSKKILFGVIMTIILGLLALAYNQAVSASMQRDMELQVRIDKQEALVQKVVETNQKLSDLVARIDERTKNQK